MLRCWLTGSRWRRRSIAPSCPDLAAQVEVNTSLQDSYTNTERRCGNFGQPGVVLRQGLHSRDDVCKKCMCANLFMKYISFEPWGRVVILEDLVNSLYQVYYL